MSLIEQIRFESKSIIFFIVFFFHRFFVIIVFIILYYWLCLNFFNIFKIIYLPRTNLIFFIYKKQGQFKKKKAKCSLVIYKEQGQNWGGYLSFFIQKGNKTFLFFNLYFTYIYNYSNKIVNLELCLGRDISTKYDLMQLCSFVKHGVNWSKE